MNRSILNRQSIVLLAATVFIQSLSFLSIKFSTLQTGLWSLILLFAAFSFMGLRAFLWQKLLCRSDLSLVYPFTSLVQVLILLYAVFLFGESIAPGHIIGFGMMLIGTYVMAGE